jgi:uncharacterized protein
MQTFDQIKKYLFIKKLSKLPFVEKIILFGSRARKTNRERSDIDLAIVCPTATETEWNIQLMDIIEEADTLLKIDCLRFDTLKSDSKIKKEILEDGIILYEKKHNG